MTDWTITVDQARVIDRMVFTALSLPTAERGQFVKRLGEHVFQHLAERGYSDGEMLLARIKYTEMIQKRLIELQAITPDQWGTA